MRLYSIIATSLATLSLTLFCAVRCDRLQTSFTVKGKLFGLDSKMVYLERGVDGDRIVIDSAALSDVGNFEFKIKDADNDPTLYELKYGWERVPILAKSGDKIDIISIGRFAYNYSIEGSRESELLRTFYQPYIRKSDELRKIATTYADLQAKGEDIHSVAKEYNDLYNDIKREQLKFIITNKGDMAALYALFQRLPGDSYLINENSDIIYMRTVADSIADSYPNSSYLKMLQDNISAIEIRNQLLASITYQDFPEIELDDMFGKKHKLSDLKGKVILLDFWSAGLGQSNPNNAQLKELYKEYSASGFEIYQVGIDTSKAAWVNAVQTQRLPWISVSDLLGGNSPTLRLYNITQLPANILISKDGEIIARDIYGDSLSERVKREVAVQ